MIYPHDTLSLIQTLESKVTMNTLEKILADTAHIYHVNKQYFIKDMQDFAQTMSKYPNQAKAVFSSHIYAINFPVPPRSFNKPIVVFYDTDNKNIIYIYTHFSANPKYFTATDIPVSSKPLSAMQLIDTLANHILPNMGTKVTNTLVAAIQEIVSEKGSSVYPPIALDIIRTTPTHPVTLESMYPRMNDPILSTLRSLFSKYNVNEPMPSDITWNKEKTWVFKASLESQYPGRYLEIEVRHAMRFNDPGMEIRVLIPGYARRIVNYNDLLTA